MYCYDLLNDPRLHFSYSATMAEPPVIFFQPIEVSQITLDYVASR